MSRQLKRQQREQDIIKQTLTLLKEKGFLDLKMAEVAKVSGCSMGVVYSHFASKEDLLLGCAIEMTRKKLHTIKKVGDLQLSDQLKLVSMPVLLWEHCKRYPGEYEMMAMACLPSVWQRASSAKVGELKRIGAETEELMLNYLPGLLEMKGISSEQAKNFLSGLLTISFGVWDIQSSGYGIFDSNANEYSDLHPMIVNLANFIRGWGIEFSLEEQEWQQLSELVINVIAEIEAEWA